MICCLRSSQCSQVPFSYSFSVQGLGRPWISRTLRTNSFHRTPMNMILCWNCYVTNIWAFSWRHCMTIIPIGTILDTLTRLSDGCSGLTLFPLQLTCQALHKTEVSSACGYELYFWCALCSSGVLATGWTQRLAAPAKWTLDHFLQEDYVYKFSFGRSCHPFWYSA